MTDTATALAKARKRLESRIEDMDEAEAATLLRSVEPAVLRFPNRRLGEATPYAMGTPEYEVFHAAVGPSVELPADQQGFYSHQAAALLQAIAKDTRETGRMVDEAVTSIAKGIADGRRYDTRLTVRLLKRVRGELLDLLAAETDKARIGKAVASFLGSVNDARLTPDRDAEAFVSETFTVLNGPIGRSGAGAVYDAMDGRTRSWLSDRLMAA